MRVLFGLLALYGVLQVLLAPTFACAETDVTVRIGESSGSVSYDYNAEWWWGDSLFFGDWNYHRNGLNLGYRDGDWGLSSRVAEHYGRSSHPNDGPGYRVFIPRGMEYPPEYYGDYTENHGTHYGQPRRNRYNSIGGVIIIDPYSCGSGYWGNYPNYLPCMPQVHTSSYPVVIDYSPRELDSRMHYPAGRRHTRYTAPDSPEYGYYRPDEDEDWDYQAGSQPLIINDNRTYNYYDSAPPIQNPPAQAASRAAKRAGSETNGSQVPVREAAAPAPEEAPIGRALGGRFYDELRLDTSDGVVRFSLNGANLYAGPEVGPAVLICDTTDAEFGAFGAYLPGAGSVVLYCSNSKLFAAYPDRQGWHSSALPLAVDFTAQTPSLGLVGNALWATVTGIDGKRYVMAFSSGIWTEIGSGSV